MAPTFHLRPGLTLLQAAHLCQRECRAVCCRGPQYLRLTAGEVERFRAHAARQQLTVHLFDESETGASLSFLDHEGERCPMLDDASSRCRIYEDRPSPCRTFPQQPRPGCMISGG